MHKRAPIVMWSLVSAAAAFFCFNGKPPAKAQETTRTPNVSMSLGEYNQERLASQEEQLRELQEFKRNQDNYNRERSMHVDHELEDIQSSVNSIKGEERGAFGFITVLAFLATVFTFKKKQ